MVRNVLFAAAVSVASIASAAAQDDDKSRGAKPKDLVQWAGKIQQAYPAAALRNAEEGTVTMKIGIDPNGRVEGCEVTGSSGSPALDMGACEGMLLHALYEPARDARGRPVKSATSQSIRYILPKTSSEVLEVQKGVQPASLLDEIALRERVFDEEFRMAINASPAGKALFALTIDATGKPTGCGMMFSSGDSSLDTRVCASLMKEANFEPARTPAGEPIPGFYSIPYPDFATLGSYQFQ